MNTGTNFVRRIALSFAVVAMALLSPSCIATEFVWHDLGAQKWQTETVSKIDVPRSMQVAIDREEGTMLFLDGGGRGVADLMMSPAPHGDEACELLLRPEWFEVDSVSFEGTHSLMNGAVKYNRGWLQIRGKVVAGAWREIVTEQDVPAAARTELASANLWQQSQLPLGLHRCGIWLQRKAARRLLPDGIGELQSFVFVDASGQVVREGEVQQVGSRYFECRRELVSTTIYARFATAERQTLLRIDPHAFYVLTATATDRKDASRDSYRRQWLLRVVGDRADVPTDQVTMQTRIWRGEVRPATTGIGTRVAQVALTPVAVAFDVVTTPILVAVFVVFSNQKLC